MMSVLIAERPYRPNVDLRNPSAIIDLDKGKKRFRFTFSVSKLVTMYILFPKDGGIRIHNGRRGMFDTEELCDIVYEQIDGNTLKMTGCGTSALLSYLWDNWYIQVSDADGIIKTVINSHVGRWGYSEFRVGLDIDGRHSLTYLDFPIRDGELFYGTGERLNSFCQNGSRIMMWNTDVQCVNNSLNNEFCDKPQGYKNIPLIHSTNGYSMFFNTFLPVEFDFGKTDPHRLITEIYGEALDLFIYTGSTRENIKKYHRLTGKPFIPPKWAFDYWIGGGWPVWNTPDTASAFEKINKVIDRYREYGAEISCAYLETEPTEEILCGLRGRGVRTFMWTNSCLEKFGEERLEYDSYRIKKASEPEKTMNYNYIDFTAPESGDVICEKFAQPWDYGVCGEMVDYADSLPEDSLCSNGKTGRQMHNEYAFWYAKQMNRAFYERLGDDFVLFQRSGCAGSQHYTASFAGDIPSSFLGLKRAVYELLSASASGISVWGSDIGGFSLADYPAGSAEMEELYIRWLQFGAFSPLMRDHSWNGHHDPWTNGESGAEVFKDYYTLRLMLADAVYSSALKSGSCGGTMAESMAVAYDMSPEIDSQYMFCENFLVRPVLELGERRTEVIIPEDGFTDAYTGKVYKAGKYLADAPLKRIPLFIRPGAVIPFNCYGDKASAALNKGNYENALLVTPPVYRRENDIYGFGESLCIVNEPNENGFELKSCVPNSRKIVLLYGIKASEVTSDAEIISLNEQNGCVSVRLASEWEWIKIITEVL